MASAVSVRTFTEYIAGHPRTRTCRQPPRAVQDWSWIQKSYNVTFVLKPPGIGASDGFIAT